MDSEHYKLFKFFFFCLSVKLFKMNVLLAATGMKALGLRYFSETG